MNRTQHRRKSTRAAGQDIVSFAFPPILAQRLKRIERLAGTTVPRDDLVFDAIDYYLTRLEAYVLENARERFQAGSAYEVDSERLRQWMEE